MPTTDIEKSAGAPTDADTLATDATSVDGDHVYPAGSGVDVLSLPPLKEQSTVLSTRSARDALRTLETFESSPDNPRNWSSGRKWRTTLTVAVTGFLSTFGSSVAVPGIHKSMEEFGYSNNKIGVLVTACYVLGMGIGPFLFSPVSELYGRQVAYQTAETCFVLFCIGTALSNNMVTLIILRLFCGMFASVGPSLGVATCADVFAPHERGRPVSIYALGPMAGPVLGPMLGYWILFAGWRWIYWTLAILAAINWVLLVSFTQETYAPVIHKKLQYLIVHPRRDPANWIERLSPRRIVHDLGWMGAMVSRDEMRSVFGKAFSRPPRLLFTNPVCATFAIYYAYIYGIIYVFLVSVSLLFGSPPVSDPRLFAYNWPQATIGLGYLSMAVGFGMSALVAATQQDRIYKYLSRRYGTNGEPEYRLVLTQIGMIVMPIGLLLFGWTAHAQTHWMGPLIGQVIIAFGLMQAFNSIQNYLVDAFYPYSAASVGAATAMRSIIACILPIFSPQMFVTLGWGWADTLLAGVAAIAIPAPWIMFKYGQRLRKRYEFKG